MRRPREPFVRVLVLVVGFGAGVEGQRLVSPPLNEAAGDMGIWVPVTPPLSSESSVAFCVPLSETL